MDGTVVAVFVFVYLGMILGRIPGLALDRTGIALLGAIFLLAFGKIQPEEAWRSIDVPTIALLLGLMVLSAQFRLGGFYAYITRRLGAMAVSPSAFLALLIVCAGLLSALLANDIVCLAMTPVLVEVCARRRLDPVPFLLALACAANVGSAATLIGNPQNMLIGQKLALSFSGYIADAGAPVILGLASVWFVVNRKARGKWNKETSAPTVEAAPFDAWQTGKGLLVLSTLIGFFVFTQLPREVLALGAAGWLLSSRHMASRKILGLVDWQLLVLILRVIHRESRPDCFRKSGKDHDGRSFRRDKYPGAGMAVRDHGAALQSRIQRTGGNAAASRRRPSAGRSNSRPGRHTGR